MLLHALHAAHAGYNALMIQTSSFCILASTMIFLVPYRNTGARFFVVGKVARALGHDICDALIGMHAFTGCDTVGACAGLGKMIIGQRAKRARHSQVCSIENRDIFESERA